MPSQEDIFKAGILIVDDQEANVQLLEQTLTGAGYSSVTWTMNPQAVCEMHREQHFDLILLDLEMPGMDGFQVMEALQEIETDGYLPVLAVTAEPGHKLRALKSGAKDFVSKPIDLAEVLMRVRNMLEVRLLHEKARNYSKALEALALNDPLTGLANRRLLSDRMSMALVHARRNQSAMAVLYLDLDGFKEINDTLGHGAGDLVLQEVAERLKDTVREEDTVARMGGDEFLIALWHVTGADYATSVAKRAVKALARPYSIEGNSVKITASAGFSIYPDHGEDAETLIESADLALYEAKRAGKNTCRISERTGLPAAAHGQKHRRLEEPAVLTEPTLAERTLAKSALVKPTPAEPTVAEPTVAKPTVAKPTVAKPTVSQAPLAEAPTKPGDAHR
jgi:two-component system, cell cycle response regulator